MRGFGSRATRLHLMGHSPSTRLDADAEQSPRRSCTSECGSGSYASPAASSASERSAYRRTISSVGSVCEGRSLSVDEAAAATEEEVRAMLSVALEMIGERDEALEQLRADLEESRREYRQQVDMLCGRIAGGGQLPLPASFLRDTQPYKQPAGAWRGQRLDPSAASADQAGATPSPSSPPTAAAAAATSAAVCARSVSERAAAAAALSPFSSPAAALAAAAARGSEGGGGRRATEAGPTVRSLPSCQSVAGTSWAPASGGGAGGPIAEAKGAEARDAGGWRRGADPLHDSYTIVQCTGTAELI